jgi:hypothetical protein
MVVYSFITASRSALEIPLFFNKFNSVSTVDTLVSKLSVLVFSAPKSVLKVYI